MCACAAAALLLWKDGDLVRGGDTDMMGPVASGIGFELTTGGLVALAAAVAAAISIIACA